MKFFSAPPALPRPIRAVVVRRLVASGIALLLAATADAAPAQIDAAATQQLIRGFGGATVFQPPGLSASLSSSDLDTLFGNAPNQIGLTLLRIRVASDDAWRAVELGHARGAIARGANVIATPWSPPAAMKTSNNIIGGSLNASAYADYAKYLNDFAVYMAANGAPLYAISVQNEPDISVTYESCDWTPAQMLAFCRNNAGAITATKVIAPESFQFRRVMSDPLLNDDTAAANLDIIGGHLYGGGLAPYPLAVSKGKEVWMTEYYDNQATDWAGALATGKNIHDSLTTANFSAYIWWYARRFYGPLGEDGVVTKRGWVMAQFAKFIRPGFVRVTATSNPTAGVFVSAFKRDKFVIVALNQTAAAVSQVFSIANTNATLNTVTPWVTSATGNLEAQAAIPVTSGSFTTTLPASSVTTFVGDLVFPAPTIVAAPRGYNVAAGSTATLDVTATGEFVTYQWSKDGVKLSGATDRQLTLPNFSGASAGSYTVTITNSGGAVTSAAATVGLSATSASRLTNLSTRSLVGAGDNVQIAGFVIGGNTPKPVLVRAAGPALRVSFGLSGALDDPTLEVRDSTGAVVASNDNWDASLEPAFTAVGAFAWTRGSKDAALLATLPPGAYTAIVSARDGGTGVAIVEVYDTDPARSSSLINLSTRSFVGLGENLQIGGFVVSGGAPRTVVIRASGPALHKSFGLAGTLADPVIELRAAGQSDALATSDDWSSFLASNFASVGAFAWPAESHDAAIVATLEPGAYSVLVRGKSNGTGLALIEVYAAP